MKLNNNSFIEGKNTTWINPAILPETLNISTEMANKVARDYNAEILSMSKNKQR